MSSLKARLEEAMKYAPGVRQVDLARHCGIKPPSVDGWFSGKAKTMNSACVFPAADLLNVNARWLCTGKGRRETIHHPLRQPLLAGVKNHAHDAQLRHLGRVRGPPGILICANYHDRRRHADAFVATMHFWHEWRCHVHLIHPDQKHPRVLRYLKLLGTQIVQTRMKHHA